jgi:hypothetical protein
MPATFSRRTILSAGVTAALAGCGETNIAQVGGTAALMWGSDEAGYDPKNARQLPYATLDAKLGKTASALLVLGEVDNMQNLHWFSADRAQVITYNLRVVKTAGLPVNLTQTTWLSLPDDYNSASPKDLHAIRQIDIGEQNMFGVVVRSEIYKKTDEVIEIFGDKIKTVKIFEKNTAKSINWEFDNYFWRDESGMTWKTEQFIAPAIPPIRLQILKPYK